MRTTASRGYGRSRSGGGSYAPRSDPAAHLRTRKVMLPRAGNNGFAALGIDAIDLVCARPERPGRGLGRRN